MSARFTSAALYNVYSSEEGQKIKTFVAFAKLFHYASYISHREEITISSPLITSFFILAFNAFSSLSFSKMFSIHSQMMRHQVASSTTEQAVKQRVGVEQSTPCEERSFQPKLKLWKRIKSKQWDLVQVSDDLQWRWKMVIITCFERTSMSDRSNKKGM